MFLSAKGMSEFGSTQQVDSAPFELVDDDLAIDGSKPVLTAADGSLLPVVAEFVRQQKIAFENLLKFIETFGYVPKSMPRPQPKQAVVTVPPATFPVEILSKPLEQLQVSDVRLGLPPGCIKILNDAGIISAAMLMQHITEQTLTKIPRVGKAKAAVIAETMRAFIAAADAHTSNQAG